MILKSLSRTLFTLFAICLFASTPSLAAKRTKSAQTLTTIQDIQEAIRDRSKPKPIRHKVITRSSQRKNLRSRKSNQSDDFYYYSDSSLFVVARKKAAKRKNKLAVSRVKKVEIEEDQILETEDEDFFADDLAFGADSDLINVRKSKLVIGQYGLFAARPIKKGTSLGWYTGRNYDSEALVAKLDELHTDYVMDVVTNPDTPQQDLLYYISGLEADERCLTTYVNHSRMNFNSEFVTVPIKDAYKGYGVLLRAARDINRNEEILADYGNIYHQRLVDSGVLAE